MMREDKALIQRTLDGDEQAFAKLVDKYQKQIHALAWQKIGDFHIAQEIVQDVFITAYNNLATLNYHNRFAGWLYVIADNKCKNWHRKKKIPLESLENMDPVELDKVYYAEYLSDQREAAAKEKKRSLVHKLISKLQESERTVVNLYYIAEMNCEDIGKFIGVSPNTVRSRLYRARERLKKEESMLRENLSSFKLPTQFTENIMEKIMNSKPITPSITKPLVPLAISAATAILAVLLIGVGAQHILSFQKPFNLDAVSEQNVEITEIQLVLDSPTKHTLQSQIGNPDVSNENNGIGQNLDATLSKENDPETNENTNVKGIRIQAKVFEGGPVPTLFATTRGDLFAGTLTDLYRLSIDESNWVLIKTRSVHASNLQNPNISWGVMTDNEDTIYLATDTEVLTTVNQGETWKTLCHHPARLPIGFVLTDTAIYLCSSERVYLSNDKGESWQSQNIIDGNENELKIRAITNIKNTVFVGTDRGLFRHDEDHWTRIHISPDESVEEGIDIHSLAAAEDQLYAVRIVPVPAKRQTDQILTIPQGESKKVLNFGWRLYSSNDKGDSWSLIGYKEEITEPNRMYFSLDMFGPRKHQYPVNIKGPNFKVKIAATKGRIVVVDTKYQSYSLNQDGNWILDDTTNMPSIDKSTPTPVFLNPNVIYRSNRFGILRSLDGGKTWQRFNPGISGKTIWEIFTVNDTLYAYTPNGIIVSNDDGESWQNVFLGAGDMTVTLKKSGQHLYARTDRMLNILADATKINEELGFNVGDVIEKVGSMNILRIQPPNNGKTLTRETPTYMPRTLPNFEKLPGNFTVTGSTFYAESNNNLYRWKQGALEWYDTRLADEIGNETPNNDSGLKIAALAKKLYVGMHNRHLMRSLDEGETWTDVTSNLPFTVASFRTVVFAGDSLYVATDKGVIRSTDGKDWETLSDENGIPPVMNRLVVANTTVYGESGQIIYSINIQNDKWKQVTPEITYPIACFDADGSKLYVGTYGSGLLLYELDE